MFPELEQALEGNEQKDALLQKINEAFETEKNTFVSKKQQLDEDNKRLRTFKNAFNELGYDGETDIGQFANSLKQKVSQYESSAPQLSELDKIKQELANTKGITETLKKEYEQAKEEKARLEEAAKRDRLASKLSPKFSENVVNHEIALDYHISKGTFSISDDGNIIYKNGDKVHEGSADEVIKKYISDYPDQAKNSQKSGFGSSPAGPNNNKGAKMKRSEWMKLNSKQRAAFFSDGGQLIE